MADWEAYRSREIIFTKPHHGQVRTKDGKVMSREALEQRYEKLPTDPGHSQAASSDSSIE